MSVASLWLIKAFLPHCWAEAGLWGVGVGDELRCVPLISVLTLCRSRHTHVAREWRASGVAGSGSTPEFFLRTQSLSMHLGVSGRTLLPSDGEEKGLFWMPLIQLHSQDGSAVRRPSILSHRAS